jgi:hypothetical protein
MVRTLPILSLHVLIRGWRAEELVQRGIFMAQEVGRDGAQF